MKRTYANLAAMSLLMAQGQQRPAMANRMGERGSQRAYQQCTVCGSYQHGRSKCPLDKALHSTTDSKGTT